MIRTSQEIELYIHPLFQLLHYPKNTAKWIALRFMINISLSLKNKNYQVENEVFDGKDYRLAQITGEGKEDEDYTKEYYHMIEAYEELKLKNNKAFEKRLEYHIFRGHAILAKSLKANSNIYDFLIEDFSE
jgi:hypothetical protein